MKRNLTKLIRILDITVVMLVLSVVVFQACSGNGGRTIHDPGQAGPYPVGAVEMTFEKTSITTGQPRMLRTVIWYPAAYSAMGAIVDDTLAAVVNAEPFRDRDPLPIIVWSHGAGGDYPYASPYYATHLASHGFIVVAPQHPGNNGADCRTGTGCTPEGMIDSYLNRPTDLVFTVAELSKLNDNPFSLFYQILDTKHVGISGHSFGGNTAVRLAETPMDAPFSAALAMSPCTHEAVGPPDKITMPILVMAGDRDTRCLSSFDKSFYGGINNKLPHFLLVFPRGGHSTFGQSCPLPIPELACGPNDIDLFKAHHFINLYATAFFKTYVAGETSYSIYLNQAAAADDADVVFTAHIP